MDADSGLLRYAPWWFGSINHQVFTFIEQIYLTPVNKWAHIWTSCRKTDLAVTQPSTGQAVDMRTVGICEKVVVARENQTYYWESLQFCFKTEGFQSHYSFGKTFSFSLKTEGNTNCSVWLKQKIFQRKPSGFFHKKVKEN